MTDDVDSGNSPHPLQIPTGVDNLGLQHVRDFPRSPYDYLYDWLRQAQLYSSYATPSFFERIFAWAGVGKRRQANVRKEVEQILDRARPLQAGDFNYYLDLVIQDYEYMKESNSHIARLNKQEVVAMAKHVFDNPPELRRPNGDKLIQSLRDGTARFFGIAQR